MTDFRQRMTSGIFITTVILFIFLILLLGNILTGYVRQEKISHVQEKLELLAVQVIATDGFTQPSTTLIEQTEEVLDGRISLYDEDGFLLETTREEPRRERLLPYRMERLVYTSEITYEEADEVNRYILPVQRDGETVGFVELEKDQNAESGTNRVIWTIILVSLLTGLIGLLFILSKLLNTILTPVKDATAAAQELAKGNFHARTYEFQFENAGNLNHSINILARNLEQMTNSYETQQDRLETLIDNMGSGLILIDEKGYVELVNRAFKDTFKIYNDEWSGQLYYNLLPYDEISDLVEDIFLMEERTEAQMLIPIQIERKHFSVHGAPIMGNKDVKGIVLVFHDITELKNLEQMRKDFVANVSHELRTPITSLKGFAETLLDGAVENKAVRERFLTIIWKESERLEHIIQDLLELTKIEQRGFELKWGKVDLANIAEDVMLLLQSKAEEKDITFDYQLNGTAVIEGDANRIRQIFINIINNSLSYTGKGGNVNIFLIEKEETVELIVEDNGIGMDKEEIPRIFERFYRVDKARSRNSGGTGLGLAIVKHLVEAHDGIISLNSEKNKGTTFSIEFRKSNMDKLNDVNKLDE